MNKNEEILVSPYTAIRLFARTYLAFGDQVLRDKKFRVTREAWIASMFLIGRGNLEREEWYLIPTRESESPDFLCYSFRRRDNNIQARLVLKIEVFEWRKEENESNFLKALKKIKLDKIVDPEMTLVCYVRRNTVLPPAAELNRDLKKIKPQVKDIWYLGDVTPNSKTWRLTQIFPNTVAVDLDFDSILKTKEKHSFIYAYRGKSGKEVFEPTGKKVLLTPEFNLLVNENK